MNRDDLNIYACPYRAKYRHGNATVVEVFHPDPDIRERHGLHMAWFQHDDDRGPARNPEIIGCIPFRQGKATCDGPNLEFDIVGWIPLHYAVDTVDLDHLDCHPLSEVSGDPVLFDNPMRVRWHTAAPGQQYLHDVETGKRVVRIM